MNCNDIRPLISAYYDGETTPEEYSSVERHMAQCEDCRHVFAEYRAIGSGMRALPVPVPPAGLRRDVWRAVGAQQSSRAPSKTQSADVRSLNGRREKPPIANPLPAARTNKGWGAAIPAMGLVAAALVIFVGALFIARNTSSSQAAALVKEGPAYNEAVQVQFNKPIVGDEAERNTHVWRLDESVSIAVTGTTISYSDPGKLLTIAPPNGMWMPGATYEVVVDAQNIRLQIGGGYLDTKPITLSFALAAFTATPTSTSTATPTAKPTHTIEPTAIAQAPDVTDTPGSVSQAPTRVINSLTNTPRPSATSANTLTSTLTPSPTRTVQPSTTPQLTTTPTATPTREVRREPSTTPTYGIGRKNTQTPKPMCSSTPVSGFGKLWNDNSSVRSKLGCPAQSELSIEAATQQHFQGGYMFWRQDTETILVFLLNGTWVSFNDTWSETDPTPEISTTPPAGLYEPVRGFGKLWRSNAGLRQHLGWATDEETGITGAWQVFQRGSTLWTSDRYIRVLYDDFTWEGYTDTYATPTPVTTRSREE